MLLKPHQEESVEERYQGHLATGREEGEMEMEQTIGPIHTLEGCCVNELHN